MRFTFVVAAAAALIASGCATAPATLSQDQAVAIVSAADRTAADRALDERRKPAELLAFIGVRPGITALDLSAARGYTTELIARAVGPTGKVIGQGPMPASGSPAPPPPFAERQKNPQLAHMSFVRRPFEDPIPPELRGARHRGYRPGRVAAVPGPHAVRPQVQVL